jgi:hypothetical protein
MQGLAHLADLRQPLLNRNNANSPPVVKKVAIPLKDDSPYIERIRSGDAVFPDESIENLLNFFLLLEEKKFSAMLTLAFMRHIPMFQFDENTLGDKISDIFVHFKQKQIASISPEWDDAGKRIVIEFHTHLKGIVDKAFKELISNFKDDGGMSNDELKRRMNNLKKDFLAANTAKGFNKGSKTRKALPENVIRAFIQPALRGPSRGENSAAPLSRLVKKGGRRTRRLRRT